jgi:hypothetical protein
VTFAQYDGLCRGGTGLLTPTSTASTISVTGCGNWNIVNYTDPIAGTNYGVYDVSISGVSNGPPYFTQTNIVGTAIRKNTISSTGGGKYTITPIFYMVPGLPTQYVTGIVPIYVTAGAIGTSGDTVDVNGDSYTFFNVCTKFGIIMKTS